MIDTKDLDYCALAEMEEKARAKKEFESSSAYKNGMKIINDHFDNVIKKTITSHEVPDYIAEMALDQIVAISKKNGMIEILDWMLQQTMTGMTLPMLRVVIHNKRVEISGEGEKA